MREAGCFAAAFFTTTCFAAAFRGAFAGGPFLGASGLGAAFAAGFAAGFAFPADFACFGLALPGFDTTTEVRLPAPARA